MTKQPAFMNWHENKPSLDLEGVYYMLRTQLEYSSVDTYGPYFYKTLPRFMKSFRMYLAQSNEYIREIKDEDPEPDDAEYELNLRYIRILRNCQDWNDVRTEFPKGLSIDIGGSEFDFWVYVGIRINWETEVFTIYNKWDNEDGPIITDFIIKKITEKKIKE